MHDDDPRSPSECLAGVDSGGVIRKQDVRSSEYALGTDRFGAIARTHDRTTSGVPSVMTLVVDGSYAWANTWGLF